MFTWYAAVTWGMTELAGADQQLIRMPASAEHGYYGLKTIALPLLLNIFFYFLLQLLHSEDGQLYPVAVREKDV